MRNPRVPAGQVAAHINDLIDQGMNIQRIWQAAQVAPSTIYRIRDGHVQSVQQSTAQLILEVRPTVTATGLIRRTQALSALGWSDTQIGRAGGLTRDAIDRYRSGRIRMPKHATVVGICRAYRALSARVPAPRTRIERAAVAAVKARAARNGWPPPLAWDDIDTDPAPATTEGRVTVAEEAEWLARAGVGWEDAARRLGYTHPEYLERALIRASRSDLVSRLKAQRRAA